MNTMDTYHPDMQRWVEHLERYRQEQTQKYAMRASLDNQGAAKQQNHEYDLRQAAHLAGA